MLKVYYHEMLLKLTLLLTPDIHFVVVDFQHDIMQINETRLDHFFPELKSNHAVQMKYYFKRIATLR